MSPFLETKTLVHSILRRRKSIDAIFSCGKSKGFNENVQNRFDKMKFRARISKDLLVSFVQILGTFEKIALDAAIFLSPECVRLAVISESIDNPKCFAELAVGTLFLDYKIESQSENTILFEISLQQLSKVLNSGRFSTQSQLKLVKRDGKPCLCFETKADESIMSVDVCHDIPIKLLKSTEVVYYLPPQIPPPSVALDLPRGKLIKTVVDKLNKFSKHIHIVACQAGRLVFKVEQATVSIKTMYNGLQPRYVGTLDPTRHVNNQVAAKVNLRKLSLVLGAHLLAPVESSSMCESSQSMSS